MPHAETTALVARMTAAGSTPSSARQTNIDNLIGALKTGATSASNIWAKIDALQVYAAHSSVAALLNWKQDLWNATLSGAPAFAADQGYTGDGAASYIDTGFNGSNATGRVYAQNDAHTTVGVRTGGSSTTAVLGFSGTAVRMSLIPRNATGNFTARANDTADTSFGAVANRTGNFTASRLISTTKIAYRNGVVAGSAAAVTSSAPHNGNFYVLRAATAYTNDQVSWFSAGSGLTAAEVSDLHTAVNAYMTAIASEGAGGEAKSGAGADSAATSDAGSGQKSAAGSGATSTAAQDAATGRKAWTESASAALGSSDTGAGAKAGLSLGFVSGPLSELLSGSKTASAVGLSALVSADAATGAGPTRRRVALTRSGYLRAPSTSLGRMRAPQVRSGAMADTLVRTGRYSEGD